MILQRKERLNEVHSHFVVECRYYYYDDLLGFGYKLLVQTVIGLGIPSKKLQMVDQIELHLLK